MHYLSKQDTRVLSYDIPHQTPTPGDQHRHAVACNASASSSPIGSMYDIFTYMNG